MGNLTQLKSGRIIAVGLILIFAGLVSWKSDNNPTTSNVKDKATAKAEFNTRNTRNNSARDSKLESLRYAYTGQWTKNDLSKDNSEQKFVFAAPVNTRNKLEPTSAKNAKKDKKKKKKKKVAKKKKTFPHRYAKRNDRFGNENSNNADHQPHLAYYNNQRVQNNPQDRGPSEEDTKDKLTPQQWVEIITTSNSENEFITAYGNGNVSRASFYAVVDLLLSAESEESKKLGFTILGLAPSPLSLLKYAEYIDTEMSTELQRFAQGTLGAYHSPNQIRTLNSLLGSSDATVKILVSNIIRSITSSIVQTNASDGKNVVYTPQQLEEYKNLLNQSLNVIDNALSVGVEGTVQASFLSARTILIQFLS